MIYDLLLSHLTSLKNNWFFKDLKNAISKEIFAIFYYTKKTRISYIKLSSARAHIPLRPRENSASPRLRILFTAQDFLTCSASIYPPIHPLTHWRLLLRLLLLLLAICFSGQFIFKENLLRAPRVSHPFAHSRSHAHSPNFSYSAGKIRFC